VTLDAIPSNNSLPFAGGSGAPSGLSDVGYDDFLTLLIAEIQHQDPLEPMDSSKFTSQLAEFSTVEQLFGMRDTLENIDAGISAQGEQDYIDLIGKTVKAEGDTLILQNGAARAGYYQLAETGDVTIRIYDERGWPVRSMVLDDQPAGGHAVAWDGKNDAGEDMNNGNYTFEVTAKSDRGAYISVLPHISGEVTGLLYENGQAYLLMGDRMVSTENAIVEISRTESETEASSS